MVAVMLAPVIAAATLCLSTDEVADHVLPAQVWAAGAPGLKLRRAKFSALTRLTTAGL
jgi:hypothetical protein